MTANWLVLVCQIVTKFQIYPEMAWVSTFMGPSQEIHGNPEIDFFIFFQLQVRILPAKTNEIILRNSQSPKKIFLFEKNKSAIKLVHSDRIHATSSLYIN